MKKAAIFLMLFVMCSCNKDKLFSKRLIRPGSWKVSSLSVGGIQQTNLPQWDISDCNIYEESCSGIWKQTNNEQATFSWQFNDKGSTFTILRQNGADSCDFITDQVEIQCFNYSGVYEVLENKRDRMRFRSSQTTGFPNSKVIIELEHL